MRNILRIILLGISVSLNLIQESSADKLDQGQGYWFQCLQSMPEGVSHPMIKQAADLALKIKPQDLKVIDLGAGTGRNIIALLEKGATVYVYDAEPESIRIIREQFNPFIKNKKLYVYQEYFEDVSALPKADLVIAWRALSFMPTEKFLDFWQKIENALTPNGIFTGTFFGKKHHTKRSAEEPNFFRVTHEEVLSFFTHFHIINFQEELKYDEEESNKYGNDQFEHIYRVIAKKKS